MSMITVVVANTCCRSCFISGNQMYHLLNWLMINEGGFYYNCLNGDVLSFFSSCQKMICLDEYDWKNVCVSALSGDLFQKIIITSASLHTITELYFLSTIIKYISNSTGKKMANSYFFHLSSLLIISEEENNKQWLKRLLVGVACCKLEDKQTVGFRDLLLRKNKWRRLLAPVVLQTAFAGTFFTVWP